jgi:competence protein ComEA
MSDEERRTIILTSSLLLLVSLLRLGWEARPMPPILPPSEVPAQLVEETRAAVEREERMNTPLSRGERIDPNRDPEVELARLPGIGPSLARRIVESREFEGSFRQVEDLLRVSGVGPATLERIRPHLVFEPPLGAFARVPSRLAPRRERGGPAQGARVPALDLNRVTAAELERLPGIGPSLSARIVEHRANEGRFESVDSLLDVPGIGPATLERLRGLVEVTP